LKQLPKSLFISHGGGPLPLLGDPAHDEMRSCLERIAQEIPQPDAIIVVSAHWEEPVATVTSGRTPSLIYDYYGFPSESYEIEYPCAGEPVLAGEIHRRLESAGVDARLDESRGFDHGVFVPLKIMYPQADIPCVQLSLVDTLDPAAHLDIGRALEGLNERNVLLVGSGFSFHNVRAFLAPDRAGSHALNESFESWLGDVCTNSGYTERQRSEMLKGWAQAPGAPYCHPREEHLIPLHVCYGAAQAPCMTRYALTIMNKRSSMYSW